MPHFFSFADSIATALNRAIFVNTGRGIQTFLKGESPMKLLVWLAKTAVSLVLVAGLSLFSAWFVVNMYVEEIMKHFSIPSIGKKIQFSDVLARLSEEWNIGIKKSASEAAKPQDSKAATAPAAGESGVSAPGGEGEGAGKPSGTEEKVPEDAVAVWGRLNASDSSGKSTGQSGSGTASGAGAEGLGGIVMSQDDFAKKKAAMSSEDKMKLFSLLVNKLPADRLQELSTLIEDGITQEELKQIDKMLQTYLSQEEYKQILDIIQKY
jgi:hypothetical protein